MEFKAIVDAKARQEAGCAVVGVYEDGALGVAPLSAIGCNGLFDSASQSGDRGTTSYSDTVTWVKGNHTIKFGGNLQVSHYNGFGRQCVS